ncbi:hypothetical protein GCG54_00013094 [Colletotrichum gloeosporioides]|uniref:Uncharacterized protein n=1 Tax=Colletotrichum gloeosporioides TaxID=474922 RepID=A0A8H4C4U3_COLGL|nr:uncharacterized protein GCG54_00013094 [Colletotrichum gloeosporioides]KAF3797486.1 hypothetical protein GCG54_00013094 [Colletotrichum gloeosporioides]
MEGGTNENLELATSSVSHDAWWQQRVKTEKNPISTTSTTRDLSAAHTFPKGPVAPRSSLGRGHEPLWPSTGRNTPPESGAVLRRPSALVLSPIDSGTFPTQPTQRAGLAWHHRQETQLLLTGETLFGNRGHGLSATTFCLEPLSVSTD